MINRQGADEDKNVGKFKNTLHTFDYCLVSMNSEEQLHSVIAHVSHRKKLMSLEKLYMSF